MEIIQRIAEIYYMIHFILFIRTIIFSSFKNIEKVLNNLFILLENFIKNYINKSTEKIEKVISIPFDTVNNNNNDELEKIPENNLKPLEAFF